MAIIVGDDQGNLLNGTAAADLIYGGLGADLLFGRAGDDVLYGGEDNDYFVGGKGADAIYGGSDIDVASYYDALKTGSPSASPAARALAATRRAIRCPASRI